MQREKVGQNKVHTAPLIQRLQDKMIILISPPNNNTLSSQVS